MKLGCMYENNSFLFSSSSSIASLCDGKVEPGATFSSNDLKNLIRKGIRAPKTIVLKKTRMRVELIKTCLFLILGVSMDIARPNAMAPLIEPAQDIIPFSENFNLKLCTLNTLCL